MPLISCATRRNAAASSRAARSVRRLTCTGGSALEAGDVAALAFVNTLVATAAAVLAWIAGEKSAGRMTNTRHSGLNSP